MWYNSVYLFVDLISTCSNTVMPLVNTLCVIWWGVLTGKCMREQNIWIWFCSKENPDLFFCGDTLKTSNHQTHYQYMSKVELWKDTQYSLVGMKGSICIEWEVALPDQPTDTDTNTRLPSLKPIQCGTVESITWSCILLCTWTCLQVSSFIISSDDIVQTPELNICLQYF